MGSSMNQVCYLAIVLFLFAFTLVTAENQEGGPNFGALTVYLFTGYTDGTLGAIADGLYAYDVTGLKLLPARAVNANDLADGYEADTDEFRSVIDYTGGADLSGELPSGIQVAPVTGSTGSSGPN